MRLRVCRPTLVVSRRVSALSRRGYASVEAPHLLFFCAGGGVRGKYRVTALSEAQGRTGKEARERIAFLATFFCICLHGIPFGHSPRPWFWQHEQEGEAATADGAEGSGAPAADAWEGDGAPQPAPGGGGGGRKGKKLQQELPGDFDDWEDAAASFEAGRAQAQQAAPVPVARNQFSALLSDDDGESSSGGEASERGAPAGGAEAPGEPPAAETQQDGAPGAAPAGGQDGKSQLEAAGVRDNDGDEEGGTAAAMADAKADVPETPAAGDGSAQ